MAKKTTTVAAPLNGEKAKAVEAAIAQIEKNYGKGAIMTLGSQPVEDIPVIPSGCIQLDMALGVGGFPRGLTLETISFSDPVSFSVSSIFSMSFFLPVSILSI